jgi:tetratricopeptide (TPR) repeat protein
VSCRRLSTWFALLLAACSAPATPPDLLRAEDWQRKGREEEALSAYQAAARSCPGATSRQEILWCQTALLGRAATLERLGRPDEAILAYERIPSELPSSPEAAATALVSAAVVHRRQGHDPRAWDLYVRVISEYPDTAYAAEAVRLLVLLGKADDAQRVFRVLEELAPRVLAHAVGDNVLYAMATLARDELGQPELARRLFEELVLGHPKSALYDDSLWYAAELRRAAHDPAGALRLYRKLLATREHSLMIGSYHSIWLDDAQLAVGRLVRDGLGKPREALSELARLPDDYPASVLLDDALYERALTYEVLGERESACRTLGSLKQRFPDSRFLLELAPALAARQGCAVPGEKS